MLRKTLTIIAMLIVVLKMIVHGGNIMVNHNEDHDVLIYNGLFDSSATKESKDQLLKKTYYGIDYNIIKKELFWTNGKIIYVENGKQCFNCERNDNIGVNYNYDVKVDDGGNTTIKLKKKKIEMENGTIDIDLSGKKIMKEVEGMYFKLDYSKQYEFCDGKLYLLDRNNVIIEDYKNEFHEYTMDDSISETMSSEMMDGVNMPEDDYGEIARFDFKGEINFRPLRETYYFDEDHSLAYDGIKVINDKKYLFNERGVLVKNGYYSVGAGIGYISDNNGVVIEKEGFYTKKPYDDSGNLDIDASFIYLDETNGSKRHYDKIYYVNSNGNVENNKFFIKDGSVYYSTIYGELLRNSYITTLFYFGNDCKLSDISEETINEENIGIVQNLINVLLINYRYTYLCGKVVDLNQYNKLQEKKKTIDLDENNIFEGDYFTIIKKGKKLYIRDKQVANVFVYYDNDYSRDSQYSIRGRYYDSDGNMVKNDIVNIDDDIYLIDNKGFALVGYKLTDGIIRKYFNGDGLNKIRKYENYFIDDTGKLLVEYNDICKRLRERFMKEIDFSPLENDDATYINAVIEVLPKNYDENIYREKEYFEKIDELPNILKTKLIDLDRDGKKELLVFKKEKYIFYRDIYFLTLDLYKYSDKFVLTQSRKLKYLFSREYGLINVGFKLNQFGEYRMYLEIRQRSNDGSFVDIKYYDFEDLKINLKFSVGDAGSAIGRWKENIIDKANEMGIAYDDNDFYHYLDSYLEKDDDCEIILSIEKGDHIKVK